MNAPAIIESAQRWRLRASDFRLLSEAGALDGLERSELIDGDIYPVSPQQTRHARVKSDLAFEIMLGLRALGSSMTAVIEVSVIVAETSVPLPDIVVSSHKGDGFMPADSVALVIEVSLSTLDYDLGRKAELYAGAGIPEYWVVDLNRGRIVMLSNPAAGGYTARTEVSLGATIETSAVPGLAVDTAVLVR